MPFLLPPRPTRARRRRAVPAAGLLGAVIALAAVPAAAGAAPTARGDFDGDGRTDLAVGAPADSVSGQQAAGAVNVLYGSARGLTARGDEQFTKSAPRLGVPQPDARFGAAVAAGDVDGDGHADLAIGAPGEDAGGLGPKPRSGSVSVLYGSPDGLNTRPGASSWSQNSIGVQGNAESGDSFGAALAMGDFDRDGRADLAIGAPGDSVTGSANAGAVHVLYGTADGVAADGDDLWTLDSDGVKGVAGANFRYGAALAAGDVSDNGRADLAVGLPGGRIGGRGGAGAVSVLYGRADGLTSVDDLWSQDARGIKGVAEAGDGLGSALAIGDFDADDIGDLAIGAPTDDVSNAAGAGAVNVLYGTRTGLREEGDDLWTQDAPGVKSRASIGETFGSALDAADFSRGGGDDLAIGVPGEQVGTHVNAGAVNVLYGDRGDGLDEAGDELWTQDAAGVKGVAEAEDRFGHTLATGDYDGDGAFDLAVGVPADSVAGFGRAGAINVLDGTVTGLRETSDQLFTQATAGVKGAVGNDRFGAGLAGGRPAG